MTTGQSGNCGSGNEIGRDPSGQAGHEPSQSSLSRPIGDHPSREAVTLCEQFINQVLVAREVSETLIRSGSWQRLKFSPVRSIAQPVGVTPADYAVDIDSSGDGWIRFTTSIANYPPIQVRYTAGMASSMDEVPVSLLVGIERLERHLAIAPDLEPPAAVTALWRPYRRLRLS